MAAPQNDSENCTFSSFITFCFVICREMDVLMPGYTHMQVLKLKSIFILAFYVCASLIFWIHDFSAFFKFE